MGSYRAESTVSDATIGFPPFALFATSPLADDVEILGSSIETSFDGFQTIRPALPVPTS